MEEREYFGDNSTVIKHETAKLEQASAQAEEAGHKLEDIIPKLQGAADAMQQTDIDVEYIKNCVVQNTQYGTIGRKIIHYQAKEQAIQDCILSLRDNDKMEVGDTMRLVRKLAAKQFKNLVKTRKLVTVIQQGGHLPQY